jgi:hypothetical protein
MLISLNEFHKFTRYKVPFGASYGHCRWSRERNKLAVLSSISESWCSRLGVSRPFIIGIMTCEIVMRYGPSDHWRSRPLISLDKFHKFTKYEAPFGTTFGHHQWSREGKKLAVLSSIS